tara:strand:+ start:22 stop:210 length:189 start_codon:yes stop_codon:yes gene_type:complete
MIDTNEYEKMTWETPSDELEDAVGNLLAEVKRMREGIEKILKNHNFPFILSGLKRELKELIE